MAEQEQKGRGSSQPGSHEPVRRGEAKEGEGRKGKTPGATGAPSTEAEDGKSGSSPRRDGQRG